MRREREVVEWKKTKQNLGVFARCYIVGWVAQPRPKLIVVWLSAFEGSRIWQSHWWFIYVKPPNFSILLAVCTFQQGMPPVDQSPIFFSFQYCCIQTILTVCKFSIIPVDFSILRPLDEVFTKCFGRRVKYYCLCFSSEAITSKLRKREEGV